MIETGTVGAKPKILFISTAKTIGGGEIYLANLLPTLKGKYECTVLGRPPLLELVKKSASTHTIRLFPASLEKILQRSYRIKKFYYKVYFGRYLHKYRYNIVNLQEFDGAFVEAIDFKPLVLTEQTRLFVPDNRTAWARRLFQKIDKIFCVSRQTMEDVTNLGVPSSKCVVIHSSVDTDKFKLVGNAGKYVTWIGRLEELDKNPMLFVKIAEAAQAKNLTLKFRMVGDGTAATKIESYARTHGIQNLELAGPKRPEEMLNIYRQASILCMTSKTEGLPLTALEALACGVPLVASDVGGLGEIIDSPKIGALISGFKESDFLNAITKITNNSELYREMRVAGRLHVEKSFSLSRQTEQIISQYEAILKGRHD